MKTIQRMLAVASLIVPAAVFAQNNAPMPPSGNNFPPPPGNNLPPPPANGNPLATPRIDHREMNQEARIQQGVNSGSLTQGEAARLERGEMRIRNMENRARADGVVTEQERQRLWHAENVENRRIYRQKHDQQHDFNHDGYRDRPYRRN